MSRDVSPASWAGAKYASRVQMAVTFTAADGQQMIPIDEETNTYSIFKNEPVSLASGANTISIPSNASGVFVIPPATNTFALTLKGIAGDTGTGLFKKGILKLPFDPAGPPASFVINNGGATTLVGTYLLWY